MPRLAHLVLIVAAASLLFVAAPVRGQDTEQAITVAGWNIGLDDADINTIAARVAEIQGVDLWGFAEVNRTGAAHNLEQAAEKGEPGDFAAVTGTSGDPIRLVALYDDTRFDLLDWYEIDAINTTGNARAPLVLHLRETTSGVEFLFMVNHLYRTRDAERYKQAQMLNDRAEQQALPVIAVGDYNFDWAVKRRRRARPGLRPDDRRRRVKWVRPARAGDNPVQRLAMPLQQRTGFCLCGRPRAEVAGREPNRRRARRLSGRQGQERSQAGAGALLAGGGRPSGSHSDPYADRPGDRQPGANLRGGPGTNFPIVGGAARGQVLPVVGRNEPATGCGWPMGLDRRVPGRRRTVRAGGGGRQYTDGTRRGDSGNHRPGCAAGAEAGSLPPRRCRLHHRRIGNGGAVGQQQAGNCDPSYPTLCIPVGIGDLDCPDITARRFPVTGEDPHRFDGDGNGIGCERD